MVKAGRFGEVSFVSTQSDVLTPSEVQENLGLGPNADKWECAQARNNWIRSKLHSDFFQGVPIAQHPTNTGVGFEYPVFTVSSAEYQQRIRKRPGAADAAATFRTEVQTGLPAFRMFLRDAAARLLVSTSGAAQVGRTKVGARLLAMRKPPVPMTVLLARATKLTEAAAGRSGGVAVAGAEAGAATAASSKHAAANDDEDDQDDLECVFVGEKTSNVLAYIELSDSD